MRRCGRGIILIFLLNFYLDGDLVRALRRRIDNELTGRLNGLSAAEAATLALLHRRLLPRRRRKTSERELNAFS